MIGVGLGGFPGFRIALNLVVKTPIMNLIMSPIDTRI